MIVKTKLQLNISQCQHRKPSPGRCIIFCLTLPGIFSLAWPHHQIKGDFGQIRTRRLRAGGFSCRVFFALFHQIFGCLNFDTFDAADSRFGKRVFVSFFFFFVSQMQAGHARVLVVVFMAGPENFNAIIHAYYLKRGAHLNTVFFLLNSYFLVDIEQQPAGAAVVIQYI